MVKYRLDCQVCKLILVLFLSIKWCYNNKWTQPTYPTQPKFGPLGVIPTKLNPNLDPGGPNPTRNRVQIGFIRVIKGLNPNLNPIWCQPEPIGPVFRPWGPTRLNPNFGSNIGFNLKKRVRLGRTVVGPYRNNSNNCRKTLLLSQDFPVQSCSEDPSLNTFYVENIKMA